MASTLRLLPCLALLLLVAPFASASFYTATPVIEAGSRHTCGTTASDGSVLTNDNWQTAANASQLSAIGFAPLDPRESAVLVTLNPGAYTAIVSGAGGTTGVGIIEVYAP